MNPYRNTIRTTGAMALISVVLNVFAQVPLVPAWEHTWTFGQDPVPGLIAPPAADDHVVVDPVSGLVHCTISDEDLLFSPRNELLFSFDPSGAEVTAAQPPVLGKAQFQSLYDSPYNGHITFGFGVYDGVLVAAHSFQQEIGNWAPYTTGGPIDGTRWTLTQNLPYPGPVPASVAIGEGEMLLATDNSITCMVYAGWRRWTHSTAARIVALEMNDNVAWALTNNGQVERLSLVDGTLLNTIDVAPSGQFMSINIDGIHQASSSANGQISVTKNDLSGGLQFSTTYSLGTYGMLTGLAVDDGGRTWVTYTEQDFDIGAVGGTLVGFDPEGELIGSYTYGASMNGVATNGQQLFITGRSAIGTTGTYLIGVDIGIITDAASITHAPTLRTWPNPATDKLNIQLPVPVQHMTLLDAAGRTVRSWPGANTGKSTLDVGGVAIGLYVLNVQEELLTMSIPVMIGR